MATIVGYTHSDGYALCTDCEDGTTRDRGNATGYVFPIFDTDEYEEYPTCDACGESIEDVSLVYTETEETFIHKFFFSNEQEARDAYGKVWDVLQGVNEVRIQEVTCAWKLTVSCGCEADAYDTTQAYKVLRPLRAFFNQTEEE